MYIDPNSGGMLFQLLAGLLGAITGFLLLFSGKIKAFIAKTRRSSREMKDNKTEEK